VQVVTICVGTSLPLSSMATMHALLMANRKQGKMKEKLYYEPDMHIERDGSSVKVYDSEGDQILSLDSNWTDDQIMHMLKFANSAYSMGIKRGQYKKQCEVASVLGLATKGIVEHSEQQIEKRLERLESSNH